VARYVSIDLKKLPQFGKDKTCEYRGIRSSAGRAVCPASRISSSATTGTAGSPRSAQKAGVADPGHFGLGIAWFDANDDGWPDLYVANDSMANFLYINRKDGTFEENAFPLGVAVSEDGSEQGGMGVAVGDYNRTGRFSVFVTNFSEEYNALYRHDGEHFTDVSFRSRTAASSLPFVGWGTTFFDYDNDGWLDLVVP
jgi:enediyne biosynthesis protein E4